MCVEHQLFCLLCALYFCTNIAYKQETDFFSYFFIVAIVLLFKFLNTQVFHREEKQKRLSYSPQNVGMIVLELSESCQGRWKFDLHWNCLARRILIARKFLCSRPANDRNWAVCISFEVAVYFAISGQLPELRPSTIIVSFTVNEPNHIPTDF